MCDWLGLIGFFVVFVAAFFVACAIWAVICNLIESACYWLRARLR